MVQRRKRRKRRQGRQELPSLGALAALADRDPIGAAAKVRSRLRDTTDPELLDWAAQQAAALRRRGRLEEARRLAEAGAGRSSRLRLEAALTAFGAGDDAAARALVAEDPELAALMRPLLAAAGGEELAAAPRALPPLQRAWWAAARAVSLARRADAEGARKALRQVPQPYREQLGTRLFTAAITLSDDGATPEQLRSAVKRLHRELLPPPPSVAGAMAEELARRLPEDALELSERYRITEDAAQRVRIHAAAHSSDTLDPVAAALQLARLGGAGVFHPEDRAAALLYEGFACLHDDRPRAARALDEALAAGADIAEVYRGKLLHAERQGRMCVECGVVHHSDAELNTIAKAAGRLARAFGRDPDAGPLSAAAAFVAARIHLDMGRTDLGCEEIALAREQAGGAYADPIDLLEAQLLMGDDIAAAEARIDAVLSRNPASAAAWDTKIEIAHLRGDRAQVEELTRAAAAATGEPAFRHQAQLRQERDPDDPLASLGPGASAGQIAAELPWVAASALEGEADPAAALDAALRSERVATLCEGLGAEQRLAVDIAALHIADNANARLDGLIAGMLRRWRTQPSMLEQLAAAVGYLEHGDVLVAAARHAAMLGEPAATEALVAGLAAGGDLEAARKLLVAGANQLGHTTLQRLQRLVAAASPFVDTPSSWKAAAVALGPEFDLFADLDLKLEQEEELPEGPAVLSMLLSLLGIPAKRLAALEPDVRAALEAEARRVSMTDSEQDMERLMARLLEALGQLPQGIWRPSVSGRGKSRKNRRNQRRKRRRK